jgi:hypothetical protein
MSLLVVVCAALFFSPAVQAAAPLKKTSDYNIAKLALRDNQAEIDRIKGKMEPLIDIQKNLLNMKLVLSDMRYKLDNIRASNRLADAVWFGDLMASVGGLATGGLTALAEKGLKEAAKVVLKSAAVNTAKDMAMLTPGSIAQFVDKSYSSAQAGRTAGRGQGSDYIRLQELGNRIRETWKNKGEGDAGRDAALKEISRMMIELDVEVETGYQTAEAQVVELAKQAGKYESDGAQIRAELKDYEKDLPAQLRDENADRFAKTKKKEESAVDKNRQTPVPPPPSEPKESAEEKRRKLQAAVDKYVDALFKRQQDLNTQAHQELEAAVKKYPSVLSAEYAFAGLAGFSREPLCERYYECVGVEKGARKYVSDLQLQQEDARKLLAELESGPRARIEVELGGVLSEWWGVKNQYAPLGFRVGTPPDFETISCVERYLRLIAGAQSFLASTESFVGQARQIESAAKEARGRITAQAVEFAGQLKAAYEDLKSARGLFRRESSKLMERASKASGEVTGFSWKIQVAAGYDGDHDLSRLQKEFAPLGGFAQTCDEAQWALATLYNDLAGRAGQVAAMGANPLAGEFGYISVSGEPEDKKACSMTGIPDASQLSEKTCMGCSYEDGQQVVDPTSLLTQATLLKHSALKSLRDAEKTLSVLEEAKGESLRILNAGVSALKAKLDAADAAAVAKLDAQAYGEALVDLEAPAKKAQEDYNAVQQRIRHMPFFSAEPQDLKPVEVKTTPGRWGPVVEGFQPLLWDRGFPFKEAAAPLAELEKIKNDFWGKGAGRELSDARYRKEVDDRNAANTALSAAEEASVREFYARFAKAYESRDDSAVMSFLSSGWQASDGTALSDVQETLRRTFRTFDEITYRVENLKVRKLLPGSYQADYEAVILSRIFRRNLKHEEKSSVSESLAMDASGKLKIESTLNGRFWYVK